MTEAADIQRLQAELRKERAVNFAVGIASFVVATWAIGVIFRIWWRS